MFHFELDHTVSRSAAALGKTLGLAMEEEFPDGPELISSELRNWVVNVGKELEHKQPRRPRNKNGDIKATIFRVPSHLLKVNRESYTPKFFSFGLYDLHERKISRLDDHRYELARVFKDIVGIRRWSRVCGKLVVSPVMTQVALYDDLEVVPEKDMETVTNLLCLDAVFVVCFIQGRHQAICKTCREQYPTMNEVIQREPLWSRRSLVLFDIFLFQNQIPLELIRNIVDLMSIAEKSRLRRILSDKSDDGVDPLHKIVMDAVEMVYSNLPGFVVLRETIQKIEFRECKHLLHCLYDVVCYNPRETLAKTPRKVEIGKTGSVGVSTEPAPEASPLPSEITNLRSESQGRKEFGNQSSLSRSSVVPATPEITEDLQPQGSGNVSFKNQAERVQFLFRGEDMARLFSPENRLGDGKKKVDERESSHNSLERMTMPQHSDSVAGTPSTTHGIPSQSVAQPGTPLPTSLNATQQAGNSIALSSFSERALSLEKESPVSKIDVLQASPAALPRKNLAADGFRVTTPDGHSSRREFFGTQGKEKIVAHRLPEPLRGLPASNVSMLRPWIASPRIFGDGSAWSLDSEPSSPRSQLSSRPASDRKSNLVIHEIGQSNLQNSTIVPEAEKPSRQERTSPGSSWGCNRYCIETGETEDTENTENRRSVSEWFPTLKCGGDTSPPRRSRSDWIPGFNCNESTNKSSPKRSSSLCAFVFRCLLCTPQGRTTEDGGKMDHVPALTQLKKVGIEVAVGKARYISEVTFKRSTSRFQATLYLPAFDVLEETEGLLRNLVAYEHIVEKRSDLLSYIHLMDNLIDSEEDVELLIQQGVIRTNSLGSSKAVADMWKTLATGYVVTLSPQYQALYHTISDHSSRIKNVRVEACRKIYLARPWFVGLIIFVIIVVVLTLMATVVATVYTVVTYYHTHN